MLWSAFTRRRWDGSSGSSGRRLLPVREANGEGDHAKHGGGVSAAPLPGGTRDEVEDPIKLSPHAFGREPDNPDVLLPQPYRPPSVMGDPIRTLVTPSIHLDRQLCRRAVEVEDIGADRMLTTELQSRQPLAAQTGP